MPSKELIEKVAKAINGPFHPVPEGSPFTLDQLRDVLWQQINGAERNLCLAGAEAAISTIRAAQDEHIEAEIDGYIENFRNMSRINGVHVTRALATLKRRLIDESPLGEQSE